MASIALLPFLDLTQSQELAYLAEAIPEEVIVALGQVAGLRVIARASSFEFKGSSLEAKAIGARLGVEWVLKGAVRKVADQLLVTVQMVEVSTGAQQLSRRFEGRFQDVFRLQSEIADCVAAALRGSEVRPVQPAPRSPAPAPGAYEHFLRGRQLLRHQDDVFLTQAERELQKAVELDPALALAWAALAQVHATRADWYGGGESSRAAADRTSEKALASGPELADSHIARGMVLAMRRDYPGAEREYEDAIRLNPRSFDAHYQGGRNSVALGKNAEAAERFQRAASLQPEDFQALILAVMPLKHLGRADEAARARQEGIRRAERLLEWNPDNTRALSLGACALAEAGQGEKALEWCRRAVKVAPHDVGVNYNVGCLYAKLGRTEDALGCLERTFGRGFGKRDWVENDPDWNLVRDHPRFRELVAKLP